MMRRFFFNPVNSVLLVLAFLLSLSGVVSAAPTVTFLAGDANGWDLYDELDGDINWDNIVDFNDIDLVGEQWLGSGDADVDFSGTVDFNDYALVAKDWKKAAGENVLLQTIYGTNQDSNGTIIYPNSYHALSMDKGCAMVFAVPEDTDLDVGWFKLSGIKTNYSLRVRLFNATGLGYLNTGHTPSKANPTGSAALIDIIQPTGSSVPSHPEEAQNITDLIVNFGPLAVTAGEYMIVIDNAGGGFTIGSIIRGIGTNNEPNIMGRYGDDAPLPKRATVTSASGVGNTYFYYLSATSATNYKGISNLLAFQILTTAVNHAPQVEAGENQIIEDPDNDFDLDGTVTDDGLPDPPATVTTLWTKESGPGTVTFGDANLVDTTAAFDTYGAYVLRLTADDSNLSAYDEVTVTYYETIPENSAPVVDAGPNQTITLPSSVTLDGTVTDDGLPDPPATVTTLWTKESGPGTVTFGDANLVDTTASFSTDGNYVLRLTANDSLLGTYDELTVTVNPFDTYEGYAPITTGGKNGSVVTVTNLNDSGAGSFRAAIAGLTGSATTIEFSVGGTINLASEIYLSAANVTIAGETAPAPGITLNGSGLPTTDSIFEINTHDVIVRHMRFRNTTARECIQVTGDYNLIFDHCSVSGCLDGALDINGGTHHIIVSRCLFAENVEVHRSYGQYASLHHNYYSYNNRRQPKIVDATGPYDFRNNVVQNWENTGTNVEAANSVNIINNYYGPPAPGETCTAGFAINLGSVNVYTNGNISSCGQDIDSMDDLSTPVTQPSVTTMAAGTALVNDVKGDCGALPRDSFDESHAGPAN